MEKLLVKQLGNIEELRNKIFPTNIPEGQKPPFCVYIKSSYKQLRTLQGIESNIETSFLINVLSKSYSELKTLTQKVINGLKNMTGEDNIIIENIEIENISDTYENELELYRSIIDIKIQYKEE